MELKIQRPKFPEIISFNYEELKQEITEKTSAYVGLVYSEDQIKDAKKDVAMLRKFTKALSDERIKIKKDCLKPYEEFERKIKELDGIVAKAITNIDSQIKAVEERAKEEKQEAIKAFYNTTQHPDWLPLEALFNPKWLNASTSMKAIEEEITTTLERINSDLDAIAKLPEYNFEALEEYKSTLHLGKAVVKANSLKEQALRKAEYEAAQAKKREEKEQPQPQPAPVIEAVPEEVPEPPKSTHQKRQWVSFEAFITVEDAKALKAFFESRNIEFKAINS